MIITEPLTINGKTFTKTVSDSGFYIERDGVQYSEAIDPSELGRTYTETDIPVEAELIDPWDGEKPHAENLKQTLNAH